MRKAGRILLWMMGGLAALILVELLAGALMPREHRATRALQLKAAPEAVWTILADHAREPQWRPELAACVPQAERHGHPVWEDRLRNGQRIVQETLERVEGRRLVRQVVNQPLFGGTWTWELAPEGSGSVLRITEEGWMAAPFRPLARWGGATSTMDAYLKALAKRLGENSAPA